VSQAQGDPDLAGDVVARSIAEASQRFGLPEHWIRAVIRAESAFDPRATSPVGAMGLMQIMPATYAELRVRHGFGPDAYDPHDNVLAGSAYLRELYDRFGPAGFLAAYNAGPGRYREHLQTGRTLPLETRLYVDRIVVSLGGESPRRTPDRIANAPQSTAPDPAAASIFVRLKGARTVEHPESEVPLAGLFPLSERSGSGRE
jgi:soluble lytic murein transglycosylase-like protein